MRPLVFALLLSGCQLLGPLAQFARGAAWVGDVIGAAEAGANVFFRRNPNEQAERELAIAIRRARLAVAALSGAVAAGSEADAREARKEALAAYSDLVDQLEQIGVLRGQAVGGAETDAPEPGSLTLPTADAVSRALDG